MGENALYNGKEIKIGTCENMYYLRWDQAHLVRRLSGNVDPIRDREHLRFRFPFPDEDTAPPGSFESYDRGPGLWVPVPEGVEHERVQFTAPGYNVVLPCPESPEGRAKLWREHEIGELRFHRNGHPGLLRIVQQAWRGGLLVLIASCGGCGSRFRLPTLEDAMPIIEGCRVEATKAHPSESRVQWWTTIADRIEAGYHVDGKGA